MAIREATFSSFESDAPYSRDEVFRIIPIASCLTNNGIITEINQKFSDLFDYQMVEILGHDLRCLANRSDTQIQPSDALQPLSHKSGKIIWVKVRNEALLDNYVIWIFEDASEQKGLKMLNHRLEQSVSNEVEKRTRHTRKTNAEYRKEIEQLQYYDVSLTQSREKYRVLFQNSQNGIIFADDNGGISQINDAMRLLMNARNLVEFNHTSVMQICHELDNSEKFSIADIVRQFVKDMLSEKVRRIVHIDRPNGKSLWTEVRSTRMHVKDFSAAITFIDRTDEILSREREAQHRRRLNRISRVSLAGHMGTALTHELGQPLNASIGYAAGLEHRVKDALPERQDISDGLHQLQFELHRACNLLKNAHSFLTGKPPQHEPVELGKLLNSTAISLRGQLSEMHIQFRINITNDGAYVVLGNPIELQQVFINLILNSMDALVDSAIAAPKIEIQVSLCPNNNVRISVSDNGPGIEAGAHDNIFEPYHTTKENGLGLGLAICRNILEAHGGMLWAEDSPNRGAIFYSTLPLKMADNK